MSVRRGKRAAHRDLIAALAERGIWTEEDKKLGLKQVRTAARLMAPVDKLVGEAKTSISYYEALDMLKEDAVARVVALKEVVDMIELTREDLSENRPILARFDTERSFLGRIAKDALNADIDRRRVEIDEMKADIVMRALAKAMAQAELTPQQEQIVTRALADGMRALPAKT